MKGDFSRLSHDPKKHFTRVLKQQGRVELDSDWNEQMEIMEQGSRALAGDLLGNCGRPSAQNGGFDIKPAKKGDKQDLGITAGSIYVDGILCRSEINELTGKRNSYLTQPDLPNPPEILKTANKNDLVYLDVWDRHLTFVEEEGIRESALGGADTTTRLRTIWQLRLLRYSGTIDKTDRRSLALLALECKNDILNARESRGKLTVRIEAQDAGSDPCEYSRFEPAWLGNRLHRIEIHYPGEILNSDGSVGQEAMKDAPSFSVSSVNSGRIFLEGKIERYEEPVDLGQPVLLLPETEASAQRKGLLAVVSSVDVNYSKRIERLVLSPVPASSGAPLLSSFPVAQKCLVVRIATFKWSSENACSVYNATTTVGGDSLKIVPHVEGRDIPLLDGDLVEIQTEEQELKCLPGILARIKAGGVNQEKLEVTFTEALKWNENEPSATAGSQVRIRRWEIPEGKLTGTGDVNLLLDSSLTRLEGDLKAKFSGGRFVCGDHWCFEVRGSGLLEAVEAQKPAGIIHHYAVLGFLAWDKEKKAEFISTAPSFPALTRITAEDVWISERGGECGFPSEVTNVEGALRHICKNSPGACTIVVKKVDGWHAALAKKIAECRALEEPLNSIRVCFHPGLYQLEAPLEFDSLTSVQVCGMGPGTVISCGSSESAIIFSKCATAELLDLSLSAGSINVKGGVNGAATFLECGRVRVERAEFSCASGYHRIGSCLTIRSEIGVTDWAQVQDCRMHVGLFQVGALFVNVRRSLVKDNEISFSGEPGSTINLDNALRDDRFRNLLVRSIMRNAIEKRPALETVSAAGAVATVAVAPGAIVSGTIPNAVIGSMIEAATVPAGALAGVGIRRAAGAATGAATGATTAVAGVATEAVAGAVTAAPASTATGASVSVPHRPQRIGGTIAARKKTMLFDLSSSTVSMQFETDRIFNADLMKVLGPQVLTGESVHEMRLSARRALDRALFERRMAALHENAKELLPAFAYQGIVVAGSVATEARITGNCIKGFLQGIHVALSHSTKSPEDIDVASQVEICGNRIEIILSFLVLARHGIFTGSFESLSVRDNRIMVRRVFKNGSIEAMRIFGRLGPMMIIEGNHASDASVGLHLESMDREVSEPVMWAMRYNIAMNSERWVSYHPGAIKSKVLGWDDNRPASPS